MSSSNCTTSPANETFSSFSASLATLNRNAYLTILPIFIVLGILGNILNLLALRNASLRSVPFRYIRIMAVYDLFGLVLLVFVVLRAAKLTPTTSYALVFYQAHFELPAINAFLTASLFTAVSLTVVRYKLICKPYVKHRAESRCRINPILRSNFNIFGAFATALLLHLPMSVEYVPDYMECAGAYRRVNNPLILYRQPFVEMYKSYQVARETVRVLAVVILLTLNLNITFNLQKAKKKRRTMMIPSASRRQSNRNTKLAMLVCFSEKKLTALMATITVVYVCGNFPAAVLMILNNDERDSSYAFHVFRAFANLSEISNHCLNFYLFCLTSKDYWKAFAMNFELSQKVRTYFGLHRSPTVETNFDYELDLSRLVSTVQQRRSNGEMCDRNDTNMEF